jgi:glycosyltransferase involved in cell wall biosynthesis
MTAGGAQARQVVLVSREVHPFVGGGIGVYVAALAGTLADHMDVTVITPSAHEPRYRRLRESGHPVFGHPRVRVHFVEDAQEDDVGSYHGVVHLWSARVFEALKELYPDGGPDLVEFPDYLGEGCVTVQAKRTAHPALRRTRVCVRMHTTAEICAVLDGHVGRDETTSFTHDRERYALRYADHVLWAGGDILETYRRFYGADALAPAERIRHPLVLDAPAADEPPPAEGPVRFLYFGRMERRKGVQDLLRALTGVFESDWELTLVGGDTSTGPLGTSIAAQLELMAAEDPRIRHLAAVERAEIPALIASHHAVVVPSLWECWPGVALEALACGRPLVATPVGGLVEMVVPGRTGWRTARADADSLAEVLEEVVASRETLRDLAASGELQRHARELTDPAQIVAGYERLLEAPPAAPAPRSQVARPRPLVSVVIPYFRLDEFVEDTVASVFAQTQRGLEVLLVNDGSLREEDVVLAELAARYPLTVLTQANSGLGAARNFGIGQARGRYVLPVDADNVLEPEFVEACLRAIEADASTAFVTTWSRYIDEEGEDVTGPMKGYQPVSNDMRCIREGNVAGDATALMRRRVFDLGFRYSQDLTSYEDWFLYRRLAAAGHFGHAIPERLLRYRVRGGSMLREVGLQHIARLDGEMLAHEREAEVAWTSRSG